MGCGIHPARVRRLDRQLSIQFSRLEVSLVKFMPGLSLPCPHLHLTGFLPVESYSFPEGIPFPHHHVTGRLPG